MSESESVQSHYGLDDLIGRVELALEQAGLGTAELNWSDLAPMDELHTRGLAATEELASGLQPEAGATALDVGCGLGGPARYLAAVHGCHVTGIDLSQPFIDVARMLTRRTRLEDRMTFVQGDALKLPFPDASFDHAWTQHVAMNIADKAGFYRSIHRALKPGGRLAIYDVVAGDSQPLIYPVPWAGEPAISFLATPEEMRASLRDAGFSEVSWEDATQKVLAWFATFQSAGQLLPPQNTLNPGVIMGPEFFQRVANLGRNVTEGRARLIQTIVQRD
jgi:SAM-dependent methyltransferase